MQFGADPLAAIGCCHAITSDSINLNGRHFGDKGDTDVGQR